MDYNFVSDAPKPNSNGVYVKSQGGTETMYNELLARLPQELKDKFQIICSRVGDLEDKQRILWLHDRYEDPANDHLKNSASLDRFEKLVFVSNQQFQTYHQAFDIPYNKSVVLRNAINPIEYKEKPKDQINLIYHTTPHRGLELLVPAFDFLSKRHENIHLDVYSSFEIYGWADRDKPYEALFDFCRNHPQITYHGFKPNSEVREALQNAHIFAYPSVWPETSCIAAIEAAAAGCAVVAPDYAALPETLLNYGFLYRYNEDMNEHANMFTSVLDSVIKKINTEPVQKHLSTQSAAFNNFYSWDHRVFQWVDFLSGIK